MRELLTKLTFWFDLNSAGGIEFNFSAKNSTDKEIKYVRLKAYLYNAVDDPVNEKLIDKNYIDVEIIGPVKSGKYIELGDEIIGYCDKCAKISIQDITLIYTDGTSVTGTLNHSTKLHK